MRYWCEWAWLGGNLPASGVLLTVEEGRLTDVVAGVPQPADATNLAGLTLPGFANTHSHAFHRALRGRTQSGEGSFWTWREEMYRVADSLDPDTYHSLAKRTYTEMLSAGYTAVGEFHYLHHGPGGRPYDDPNAMSEAVVSAAEEVGIRITLLDTVYLQGGMGDQGQALELNPTQERFSDGSAELWAQRFEQFRNGRGAGSGSDRPQSRVRIGAAIHSVRAVDPRSMEVVRDLADVRGIPLHIHLSEQPAENQQCLAAHGRTPTGLLHDLGILGERLTAVHATHLTNEDISLLGGSRSTACMCPTTERDLADGIGPSRRLVDAGARLAVGSDSHAVLNPFEETRAVELNERLATLRRGNHPVTSLLEAATTNGYAALGWPNGGRIERGALADLVTVSVEPDIEPEHMLASVVFTNGGITSSIVDGAFRRP